MLRPHALVMLVCIASHRDVMLTNLRVDPVSAPAALQAAFDASPFATVIFDAAGRPISVNRAFEELWGVDLGVVAAGDAWCRYPPLHDAALQLLVQRAFSGEVVSFPPIQCQGPWGTGGEAARWIEVTFHPVGARGAPVYFVAQHRDVTLDVTTQVERLQYVAMLDSLSEGVAACDAAGRLTLFNRANREFHGLDAVGDLAPEHWSEHYAVFELDGSTTFPTNRLPLVRVLRGEAAPVEEMVIHSPSHGGPRRVVVSGRPIHDAEGALVGGLVTVRDVTDERHQERLLRERKAALRQSEERFRGAFEHSGIGFAIVGLDGGWLQINRALARITGYAEDELRALTFQDITHPEDLHADLQHLRALVAGEVPSYEMEKRYFRKDRTVVHVLLTVSLVRDGMDAPVHFVAQIQDLTERRITEERLRHTAKLEAVATLASGIAHDFNNLLTVVRGSADFILADPEASAFVQHDATAIRVAVERAQTLTRELLSFAGRQVRDAKMMSVAELLHTAAPLLRRLLTTQHTLTIRGSAEQVAFIADENELQLALLNLVDNARDAMPGGGVVTVTHDLVHVRDVDHAVTGVQSGRYVRLVVEDSGEGLSNDAQAHLFEPFFSTKPTGKGTGLGLATVYGVVHAIGGTVTYERIPSGGARFILWIPATADHKVEDPKESAGGVRLLNDWQRSLVVVVDDEESVLAVVARALRRAGFIVLTAEDGASALALLGAHPDAAALVTDFVMPGMSGKALLEAAAAQFPAVRRVLMSGYAPDRETRETLASTGTAFIGKPFAIADLITTVRQALEPLPPGEPALQP